MIHFLSIRFLHNIILQVSSDTKAFRNFLSNMIAMKKDGNSSEDGGFISHVLSVSRTHSEFPDRAVLDELSTYMTAVGIFPI